LIDAAARRFSRDGFTATSLRGVARDAGVTPAMVAYYFEDKQGLLRAVLEAGLDRIVAAIGAALAASADGDAVPRFVRAYLGVINAHPWIPRILVQEVIARDSPLRQFLARRLVGEVLPLVRPALDRAVALGRLRGDLDPRLTLLSLVGMSVFPYIAEPVLGPLLGYAIDPEFGTSFTEHTVSVALRGLGGGS
jgi:AcrR family transcriptional regulator